VGSQLSNCVVTEPVLFNCIKHHLKFIKHKIFSIESNEDFQKLLNEIITLGNSVMDLYCGELIPQQISSEIIDLLSETGKLNLDEFVKWINGNDKKYRLFILSDKSIWTLRIANNKERYIHIHPGRYSPLSIRVKAVTLKTIIAAVAYQMLYGQNKFDINLINKIRMNYLNEPPLKNVYPNGGIDKLYSIITK
jgi:hypothetical protein